MLNVGVSTACLYPMPTEEALEQLANLSVTFTEVFINSHQELQPDFCQRLRHVADGAGMRILAIHPYTSGFEPFLFFSNYPRRFEDGMEYYRNYYRAAKILGADYVIFHGAFKHCDLSREEYFNRYLQLCQDARSFGVELVHENVERCVGAVPDFFEEMGHKLPQCGTVLDVKQALRAGVDPLDMARAMRGRIRHIHISDHTLQEDCVPYGQGIFRVADLLNVVLPLSEKPSVVLELYRSNFHLITDLDISYKKLQKDIENF